MGETGRQIGHEVAGLAEKAAGAAVNSGELDEKGEQHLEEAEKLQRVWDTSRAGSTKDSDGRGIMDKE